MYPRIHFKDGVATLLTFGEQSLGTPGSGYRVKVQNLPELRGNYQLEFWDTFTCSRIIYLESGEKIKC
jgi:hypothetical protein